MNPECREQKVRLSVTIHRPRLRCGQKLTGSSIFSVCVSLSLSFASVLIDLRQCQTEGRGDAFLSFSYLSYTSKTTTTRKTLMTAPASERQQQY
ncbi:hypothetical protein E2C01_028803 [Portunus trituberculatus]|uniref:Uncharacterized protein n=1 Tax=Portunus trituberculatus TaxID=210409 RepID=A0A5B7EMH7_PORTR|nr:hypothetical protein [Portunus trituberculatus]